MIALSGDYRSKKEVAYTLVPAIGRRIIDLGGNVEKGDSVLRSRTHFYLIENILHKLRPSNSLATLLSLVLSR